MHAVYTWNEGSSGRVAAATPDSRDGNGADRWKTFLSSALPVTQGPLYEAMADASIVAKCWSGRARAWVSGV